MRSFAYKLLRRSEAFFKTDMVYLIKGGFWLAVAQIVISGSSFVLSILFARYLTQEAYGNYKYVLSIAAILSSFTLTGLGSAAINAISRGLEGTIRKAFKESLFWSAPMILGSLGVALYYLHNNNVSIAISMIAIAITTPFINSGSLYSAYLTGKKDFKRTTLYYGSNTILVTVCVAATIFFTQNFVYAVFAYFLANAVGNILLYIRTLHVYKPNNEFDPDSPSYGRHLTLINLLNIFSSQIDKVLLFHYLGAADVAVYSFAVAMPDQIKAVLASVSRLALPKYAERSLAEIKHSILPKMAKYAAVIVGITIVYIFAAPYIFEYIFPKYIASEHYSQIMAVALIAAVGSLPLTALQAHATKKALYVHAIALNTIRIGLMLILIPLYGLLGAIIANVLGRFASLLLPTVLLITTTHDAPHVPPQPTLEDSQTSD